MINTEGSSRTIQDDLIYHYPSDTIYYKYDAKGNLIDEGAEYDNNTSYLRTHPLWMFLNRNYSVNNNFRATGYNGNGMPLKIRYPPTTYLKFSGLTYRTQTSSGNVNDHFCSKQTTRIHFRSGLFQRF